MTVQISFFDNHNYTNLFFDDGYDDKKEHKNVCAEGDKEEGRR